MEKPQNEFQTKNLFVATFLLASGQVEFRGLKKLDYKTRLFCFSPKKKAEELEIAYFSGAKLSVKQVFAEYNALKDMLFQREPNGDYHEKNQ